MPGPILETLCGQNLSRRPIWLMRQAGRYLPEYRALRAEKGGFLELVYDTDAAAEITLQPIRRFFDGAILFSDILIVPYAMGQDLTFTAGEGPRLSPPLVDSALSALQGVPERLAPIYATVGRSGPLLAQRPPCWALPAVPGPWRPTWWRARAAATITRRAAMPIAIRRVPGDHRCHRRGDHHLSVRPGGSGRGRPATVR
jgi:uroporphyrinogen decarboxylase